jgi:bis(5'-nucleosidyl)-tetraphosphatase
LLLRAYNYWDFPKGVVESGETPLLGAIREVEEETTITQLNFRWGYIYRETYPYNHGRKVARYYIAETSTTHVYLPVNPLLGRPEHSEYRWVNRNEAWQMLTPRVRAILDWANGIIGIKASG